MVIAGWPSPVAHQRLLDEDPPRGRGVDPGKVNHASGVQHAPIQRDGFAGEHHAALDGPFRVAVVASDQMRSRGFDPRRLDLRHHPRVHAMCLHQACGHDPVRTATRERRPRCNDEAGIPRAEIGAILIAHADTAQEPGEQCAM